MSVRIRMKKMGRKHRPFYRICAMDIRRPRDGRILEELGTYDLMVPGNRRLGDPEACGADQLLDRCWRAAARISASASLSRNMGAAGTHVEAQRLALGAARPRRPGRAGADGPQHEPAKPAAAPAEAPAAEAEVKAAGGRVTIQAP